MAAAIIPPAYPFVSVLTDTKALMPIAQRQTGVVALVGRTESNANDVGTATANAPVEVSSLDDAKPFAGLDVNGVVNRPTDLYTSLLLAMQQNPPPQKIYAVKVAGGDYDAALASIEAISDITFVALANEPDPGAAGPPPTNLAH